MRRLRELLTDALVYGLTHVGNYKNRCLAERLFELTLLYDPDPDRYFNSIEMTVTRCDNCDKVEAERKEIEKDNKSLAGTVELVLYKLGLIVEELGLPRESSVVDVIKQIEGLKRISNKYFPSGN